MSSYSKRPNSAYNGKVGHEYGSTAAESITEHYGTATRSRKVSGYDF
jgi:hypothetical protein